MKTKLIAIGNSRGIRIPKTLIEQLQLSEEVELYATDGELRIRPADRPRADWMGAFKDGSEADVDDFVSASIDPSTDEDWTW
jgi:antitoxin MazE